MRKARCAGLVVIPLGLGSAFAQTCSTWVAVDPAPPSRCAAGVAFDSSRGRLVLFGGVCGFRTQRQFWANDTWEWRSDVHKWTRVHSGERPIARDSAAVAFDPRRNKVVLFGGLSDLAPPLEDTWEFDCSSGQWEQKFPAIHPSSRQGAAMVHDPVSGYMLMFGGQHTASHVPNNELWEWNGDVSTWTQRSVISSPSPRAFMSMAPENASGKFVLHGGLVSDAVAVTDTWRFESSTGTWTQLSPRRSPGSRCAYALVPNPKSGRVLLFGGSSATGAGGLADTWEWDVAGEEWIERHPAQSPSPRLYAAGAFDSHRNRPVIYGGYNAPGSSFGDIWEWESAAGEWSRTFAGPSAPAPSTGSGIAYDPIRARSVLVAPVDWIASATMWEWDAQRWHPIVAPAPIPWPAPLAFDGTRVITAFGAEGQVQTWGWSGQSWSRLADSPMSPTVGISLAFDSIRNVVVMFAGPIRQTWEWNGTAWQFRSASGPSARYDAAMCFDSVRGLTIVHGGSPNAHGSPLLGDSWVWNGSQWSQPIPGSVFAKKPSLAFDSGRAVNVMVSESATYEWNGTGPWTTVPLAAAILRRAPGLVYHAAANQMLVSGGWSEAVTTLDESHLVTLARGCSCYANCDSSSLSPVLTANDFMCFLSRFAANDPYANCDGSTASPTLTAADFQCFVNAFAGACP